MSLSPLFPEAAEPASSPGSQVELAPEGSLHARQLTHWILRQLGERSDNYYFNFAEVEIKAHKWEVNCPKSHTLTNQVKKPRLEPSN